MPASEKQKIDLAAKVATVRRQRFMDIIGHASRTESNKKRLSQDRADNVKAALIGLGVSQTVSPRFFDTRTSAYQLPNTPCFTEVRGVGSTQRIAGAPAPKNRRVEIFISSLPHGAASPAPASLRFPRLPVQPMNPRAVACCRWPLCQADDQDRLAVVGAVHLPEAFGYDVTYLFTTMAGTTGAPRSAGSGQSSSPSALPEGRFQRRCLSAQRSNPLGVARGAVDIDPGIRIDHSIRQCAASETSRCGRPAGLIGAKW